MTDPSLIREISLCVSLDIGKPTYLQKGQEPLFGQGIIKSNGLLWAHQRKLISPEFYMDKVKVFPIYIYLISSSLFDTFFNFLFVISCFPEK